MDLVFKSAEQSADDPYEFVMSSESVDRVGDIIVAKGWQLDDFNRNPVALFMHDKTQPIGTWDQVKVVGKQLVGRLKLLESGLIPRVDEVRQLLEARILRAVSVGFIPLEKEPISKDADPFWGPFRYLKSKLLECSVVSVPANADALRRSKGLELTAETRALVVAKSGIPDQQIGKPPTAKSGPELEKQGRKMTLAERIRELEQKLVAAHDKKAPLDAKFRDDEDVTDEETLEFDALTAEIEKTEKDLARLRSTEKDLGMRTAAAAQNSGQLFKPAVQGDARKGAPARERPMDILIKMAVCHLQAHATRQPIEAVRALRYGDRDDIAEVIKAVTNPAQTTVAGWAAELVTTGIDDLLESLKPVSVYGGLSTMGTKFTFGRNGQIKLPRRNQARRAPGDLAGAFVGEGQPIPVRRGSFGSVTLVPHKMGVISTYTREMALHSTPAIENLIREGIIDDTAIAVDAALLDTVAGDAIRPAGLLNGVTPIAGTAGGGTNAIDKDLQAIIAPFITANAADRLVFLINPSMIFKLQYVATTVGVYPYRDQINAGNIGGFPYIASTSVPTTQLILLRVADFSTGVGDSPEFDVSDVATIHEEDGSYPATEAIPVPGTVLPIVDGAGAAAAPVRSLWQTASIGIRMLLDMDWAMRRSGMVAVVNGLTW
ncbi:MAG TPA: phage major capsid protein [Phyllobacterium sp.]|nr:phage major capsid protein [Phyllobacterium sp.]